MVVAEVKEESRGDGKGGMGNLVCFRGNCERGLRIGSEGSFERERA